MGECGDDEGPSQETDRELLLLRVGKETSLENFPDWLGMPPEVAAGRPIIRLPAGQLGCTMEPNLEQSGNI